MADKEFVRVDEWNPTVDDIRVYTNGKLIVIPFDRIFNRQNGDVLNNFVIKKDSYVKRLPFITQYINYFIKYYDDDNELIMAYLKLKSIIDNKKNKTPIGAFIKYVYNILLSDKMMEKILKMTEDNYYISVESDSDIKYNESLEFTDEHGKILMQISIAMKLMVPVVFHYLNTYNMIKNRVYIFRFYEGLFDLFGGEIDIYNKLWISIFSKVNVNVIRNKIIWGQREIFGVDQWTEMEELLKYKIISETIFKYSFNKNMVNLNHVILRRQLGFFLVEPYKTNRIELSAKPDNITGLSGLDKLEMNSSKIDESIIILSKVNIKKTIKRLQKKMHITITKEEIMFYKNFLKITPFQSQLLFYYYAKYFSGYRDLRSLNRTQYLKLLIMMKKRLQYQGDRYLPQILTSNIQSKLNARTIKNNKFITKIESSSIYQSIISEKYSTLGDIDKDELILNLISTLLNTTFTVVDYEHIEDLGKVIEVDQDALSDEFLNYLNRF